MNAQTRWLDHPAVSLQRAAAKLRSLTVEVRIARDDVDARRARGERISDAERTATTMLVRDLRGGLAIIARQLGELEMVTCAPTPRRQTRQSARARLRLIVGGAAGENATAVSVAPARGISEEGVS